MAISDESHEQDRRIDRQLIVRARTGDVQAWRNLVERHSRFVFSVIRAHRVAPDDEADAFQYVFVQVFQNLETLVNVDNLPAWIRTVASRHAIRLRDTGQKRPLTGAEVAMERVQSEEDVAADLEKAELEHRIRLALEQLPATCRTLVERLFLEDPPRPYTEVAQELGMAVGSIGATRQRCLDRLERLLRELGLP